MRSSKTCQLMNGSGGKSSEARITCKLFLACACMSRTLLLSGLLLLGWGRQYLFTIPRRQLSQDEQIMPEYLWLSWGWALNTSWAQIRQGSTSPAADLLNLKMLIWADLATASVPLWMNWVFSWGSLGSHTEPPCHISLCSQSALYEIGVQSRKRLQFFSLSLKREKMLG